MASVQQNINLTKISARWGFKLMVARPGRPEAGC
jgi:hypothetical protein